MKNNRIILGIDPGTNIMGFGIIEIVNNKPKLVVMEAKQLYKTTTDSLEKLGLIFKETQNIIQQYAVTEVAIETPFYGKNIQSMLKLGRAQGIAIAAAIHEKITVEEYAPRKIKLSITGKGSSSKNQVSAMLEYILGFKHNGKQFDATDAVAVALCHFFQNSGISAEKKGKVKKPTKKASSSWATFIKQNPDRLKS
ncbi:MAG: crossover junction endodeoxyribonuclease RuvC [Flavobacteriales bacterium]|nr:crossover junction endodeoxyribonuclease RuvC [Flavobacteriales bacterium]